MAFPNLSISQLKRQLPALVLLLMLGLSLLLALLGVRYFFNIPIGYFTRDPAEIFDGSPLAGLLSNLGALFWCTTAAVCFFTFALNRLIKPNSKAGLFFLHSGLFTLFLLVDDFFMFHDKVGPQLLHLPEFVIYLAYLLVAGFYFFKHHKFILQTEYILLGFACGLFALSISCDLILHQDGPEYLLEDLFKFLGILTWCLYFTTTCFKYIRQIISGANFAPDVEAD